MTLGGGTRRFDNQPANERQMVEEAPVDKRQGGLNCNNQPVNKRQTEGEAPVDKRLRDLNRSRLRI